MDLYPELTGLMAKYSFRPNKRLGQHFVVSSELVKKMASEAELKNSDIVLEIGPGTGFLTREIMKHCRVIAVEADENLADLLEQEFGGQNIEIIKGDFLEAELPKFDKIVSLPPYNISAKIMQKLFSLEFELALLVFQKEFVEKLLAFPGFSEYNSLSVLTQYHFIAKVVSSVGKNSFFPRPKTDSVLLKLAERKRAIKANDEQAFQFFLKSLFRYSNRNLGKALQLCVPFFEKETSAGKVLGKKIGKLELREKKVNLLEVHEFVEVFNELF